MYLSFQDIKEDAQGLFDDIMGEVLDGDDYEPGSSEADQAVRDALSDGAVLSNIFSDYYPRLENFEDEDAYIYACETFDDSEAGKYIIAVVEEAYTLTDAKMTEDDCFE
jgi:hypothetical protein